MPSNRREPPLDVEHIRALVGRDALSLDLRYLPEVDSTNRIAAELPPGTWEIGTTVFTDHQTAGRGRRGRQWVEVPNTSLLLSVLLRPARPLQTAEYVGLAALSVGDAVTHVAGAGVTLKWPNDVLLNGKKVSGILLEGAGPRHDRRVILGMGVNANLDSEALARFGPGATSLKLEGGSTVSREELAAALLRAIALWYGVLIRAPNRVFDAWSARLQTLGKPVEVIDGTGAWQGVARTVTRDGALVVELPDGTEKSVYAGDVSVRDTGGLQDPEGAVQ